jgi:hypothetical protein
MSQFEADYEIFLTQHIALSKGARRRRLEDGHGHGEQLFLEQVWWPAFGNLDGLHPEYEVYDFKDGRRYLDYAWFYGPVSLAIEIDGFKVHVKDLDQEKFSDQLTRQNDLVNDGWRILRFSYEAVRDRPRSCQQQISHFMGRWTGARRGGDLGAIVDGLNVNEREVLRAASRRGVPFGISETMQWLDVHRHTAVKVLTSLHTKGWLTADGLGPRGTRKYNLNRAKVIDF